MATGMCWPKYQILYVLKIKVVFTPSSYNVSASCSIIYNLQLMLDTIFETNLFLVIALGDFNAKLSQWYKMIKEQLKVPK